MQSAKRDQTSEGNSAGAPETAAAVIAPLQQTRTPQASPALLANDQIAKLQKILRSMDHSQLQSVLSALEPNVLRLCLHAIFGKSKDIQFEIEKSEQSQLSSGPGLAAHAKILAQTKVPKVFAPHKSEKSEFRAGAGTTIPGALRRVNPRTSTQKNAKIYCPIDKVSIDCLILDTSKSGALVFLDYNGTLPETFALFDIGDQQSSDEFTHLPHKKCNCIWHKRNKMGVKFVD